MSCVAKQLLREAVEHLPEDATVEDAMDRLDLLAKITRGLEAAHREDVVSHDDARRTVLGEEASKPLCIRRCAFSGLGLPLPMCCKFETTSPPTHRNTHALLQNGSSPDRRASFHPRIADQGNTAMDADQLPEAAGAPPTNAASESFARRTMRSGRPSQDIRPLSEFRASVASVASFVEQVQATQRPLVLTQHGRSAAILLAVDAYDALVERAELAEDVRIAEAQLAAGQGVAHGKAFALVLGARHLQARTTTAAVPAVGPVRTRSRAARDLGTALPTISHHLSGRAHTGVDSDGPPRTRRGPCGPDDGRAGS